MARVLIVEPHGDIRALLEVVVRRLGHEPLSHEGGELDQIHLDAAVVEPGDAGGLRVARRLREKGVPVLFTSIFPADAETLALEPTAYLVKPFPLSALEHALNDALAGAAALPA